MTPGRPGGPSAVPGRLLAAALPVVLLVACTPEPTWGLVTEPFGEAMLLSAYSDGETAWIVGGPLPGTATLVRYADGVPCVAPSPAEHTLWWIHGRAGDWVAVGERGTVVHASGERDDIDTDATLYGVWVGEQTTWVVGGDPVAGTGAVWRRDPAGWTAVATDLPGPVFKVWKDWFVGPGGARRLEGGELVAHPVPGEPPLTTVRGRGPADVWAVGGVGGVVHWDGAAWSDVDAPLEQPVNGVWTAPGEALWVAGAFGLQARWDGATWTRPERPVTAETFHAVAPHGAEMLFVGGNFYSAGDHHGVLARWGPPADPLVPDRCP